MTTTAPSRPLPDAPMAPIAFVDLAAQRRRIADRVETAIARVLEHGRYIQGPEVAEFERRLARRAGVRHAVSCANGTDALVVGLRARGIGPGDTVIVPAFSFGATAEAVGLVGAECLFVDVRETDGLIDPSRVADAIEARRTDGRMPRAIVPVELYGYPVEHDTLAALARRAGLFVLLDGAQSFGAAWRDGRSTAAMVDGATTSFFPAKPLGCYGDGGAILTNDDDFAATARSICHHGRGRDKYDNARLGTNSRLDTLQAAILMEKLEIFDEELTRRDDVVARYDAALRDLPAPGPRLSPLPGTRPTHAAYTLRVHDRDRVASALAAAGIPTQVYYPKPLPEHEAYRGFPTAAGGVPVARMLSRQVLSLPAHAYLTEAEQDRVVTALRAAVGGAR